MLTARMVTQPWQNLAGMVCLLCAAEEARSAHFGGGRHA